MTINTYSYVHKSILASFLLRRLQFLLCFIPLLLVANILQAQYYTSALGKNGAQLKTALHNIIKGHTVLSYTPGVWDAFTTTDNKGANQVWDIYSDIPGGTPPYVYTLVSNQCGTYNSEADCYNREHTWPQYYFNSGMPMTTDLHHVYPTDGWVNNKRNNFPYGVVSSTGWTSMNGSKTGTSTTYPGYTNDVFEPIDSFKGDLARAYFYMSTRYESEDTSWVNWEMATGAELTPAAIILLLDWHHADPVSQKEQDRNNAIYLLQGNRNPFIDYPQFADCIWGIGDCTSLSINDKKIEMSMSLFPNPTHQSIQWTITPGNKVESVSLIDITGRNLETIPVTENKLSVSNLPNGMYFLQLHTQKGLCQQRFIKN